MWLLSTGIDRLWWESFDGLPAWDQAEYLNSALDHGKAMGLLYGSNWTGIESLLDLSPKIPPLASLVNGSVMAVVGDDPAQVAWSLSIWHGLLLISVAGWGLELRKGNFALLSTFFVAIAPALLQLRSDYVLEMPLTACLTLAIWRMGNWLHPTQGGKWWQAISAALTCTAALLIKQSALLVLIPMLGCGISTVTRRKDSSRWQLITGCLILLFGIFPWLRHNWITALGGTNRAVIESATREGDPSLFTVANWLWYPRVLPEQLGIVMIAIGLSGCVLWLLLKNQANSHSFKLNSSIDDSFAWQWLIITLLTSWIVTSLSPNKDSRYITPLLPPLILLLTRGWWEWGLWSKHKFPQASPFHLSLALISGVLTTLPTSWASQTALLANGKQGPLEEIVREAGGADPNGELRTLIVIPSTPDLNQHNVSYFGRRQGGQLIGRQLGTSTRDIDPLLEHGEWVVLAEGEQGSVRGAAALLDAAVRKSTVFIEVKRFYKEDGNSYSLWQRRTEVPKTKSFVDVFPRLASNLGNGPIGLEMIFTEIAIQHMLDGHFKYRRPVKKIARERILEDHKDLEAHWALALMALLENRPNQAEKQFSELEALLPNNPWPSTYRVLVNLANWNPWKAAELADKAHKRHKNPVLKGLGDLSGTIGGALWRFPAASKSVPKAIQAIETSIVQNSKNLGN